MSILRSARKYIERGFPVVPIPPRQKGPVLDGWQKLRIDSPDGWFQENSNIGIILGNGLICVDLDHPVAVELATEYLPQTGLIAGRANGGKTHWFYRVQGTFKKVAFTSECKQKIVEILGDGQQVVVGPSIHPSGDVYDNLEGEPATVDAAEIVEACRLLSMRCFSMLGLEPKKQKPQANEKSTWTSTAVTDLRQTLNDHGAEILGDGETKDGCSGYFVRCPRESSHTSKNGEKDCMVWTGPKGGWQARCLHTSCGIDSWAEFRSALDPFWIDAEQVDDAAIAGIMAMGSNDPKQQKPEPVNPDAMTDIFYQIPGLIGDMIAYHREYAPRPRPELSLAASIALMGAVTGRKIQTKSGMRTNVYCVGLAPSGSGKEKPRNNNVMAIMQAGMMNYLGSENPASDAALIEELSEHPAKLIQIDEVSRYFSTLKNAGNNSTHLKNIFTRFLELTGQAENPAWTPKGYADKRKSKTICHPHLCIYGTSTSDGFWASVAASDAVDGFLARMMVIEADRNYPRLRDVETKETPGSVIDVLKDWNKFVPPSGNLGDQFPQAVTIHMDSAATDRIQSHSDGIEDRLQDEPDDHKAIWSRASALAKRLSLIFAASRGPFGIAVTLEDAIAAVRLANWCTRLLIRRVFTHVAANESDSEKKRVLEIIRRSKQVTLNQLTRKTQWIRNRRSRAEILDELLEGGYVVKEIVPALETGGSALTVFRVN